MMCKKLAIVTVCLGLVGAAGADPPDATSVLKQAQAAAQAVESATYEAELSVSGPLAEVIGDQVGKVTIARPISPLPRVRVEATRTAADGTKSPWYQLASDGTTVSLIDHRNKEYQRSDGREGLTMLFQRGALILGELVMDKPFEREVDNSQARHLGMQKVGDLECQVVEVPFGQGKGRARWFFSATDHLPRRLERVVTTPGGEARQLLTLKSLKLNPAVNDEMFRLEAPEGYEILPAEQRQGSGSRHKLLEVGTQAPDWSLKTPDGRTVTLKELRGKVVVMDFWATWCAPCKIAMPGVQKIHEKYKDKPVVVYGISTREQRGADPAGYMKEKSYTYGLLLNGEKIAADYLVGPIPVFYVVGHDGKILYGGIGTGKDAELDHAVEAALQRMK